MNRRKLAALASLLLVACLCAVAFGQRIKKHGALIDVSATGGINITPATGQTIALGGATTIAGSTVTGRHVPYSTKTALTPGATVAINSALGNFFTLTPGEDETINATTVGLQGQVLFIKILTSGTTSRTLTFGTNFKSTGTLATGTASAKTFMIQFLSDGTNYVEVSRTAAQ